MIPPLDAYGLRPPGVWDCTLEEIDAAFGWNPHRKMLLANLRGFLAAEWVPLGIACPIYIDGSFVRSKPLPSDIDLVLDLTAVTDLAPLGTAYAAVRLRHDALKAAYTVDAWLRHPLIPHDLAAFFQYVGTKAAAELRLDTQHPKGILRMPP